MVAQSAAWRITDIFVVIIVEVMRSLEWLSRLEIGHHLDVKDTIGRWCVAQVIDIEPEEFLLVHYVGWELGCKMG